jgi:hypothetical protein
LKVKIEVWNTIQISLMVEDLKQCAEIWTFLRQM